MLICLYLEVLATVLSQSLILIRSYPRNITDGSCEGRYVDIYINGPHAGDGLRWRQLISKTVQFKYSPASSSLVYVTMVL